MCCRWAVSCIAFINKNKVVINERVVLFILLVLQVILNIIYYIKLLNGICRIEFLKWGVAKVGVNTAIVIKKFLCLKGFQIFFGVIIWVTRCPDFIKENIFIAPLYILHFGSKLTSLKCK